MAVNFVAFKEKYFPEVLKNSYQKLAPMLQMAFSMQIVQICYSFINVSCFSCHWICFTFFLVSFWPGSQHIYWILMLSDMFASGNVNFIAHPLLFNCCIGAGEAEWVLLWAWWAGDTGWAGCLQDALVLKLLLLEWVQLLIASPAAKNTWRKWKYFFMALVGIF